MVWKCIIWCTCHWPGGLRGSWCCYPLATSCDLFLPSWDCVVRCLERIVTWSLNLLTHFLLSTLSCLLPFLLFLSRAYFAVSLTYLLHSSLSRTIPLRCIPRPLVSVACKKFIALENFAVRLLVVTFCSSLTPKTLAVLIWCLCVILSSLLWIIAKKIGRGSNLVGQQ